MNLTEQIIDIPSEYILTVFGKFDSNIKKIERTLNVTVIDRGDGIKLIGTPSSVDMANRVLTELIESARKGNSVTEHEVNYLKLRII